MLTIMICFTSEIYRRIIPYYDIYCVIYNAIPTCSKDITLQNVIDQALSSLMR